MSAGTLALTNGSTSVTGTNTVFQTDLAANDFIVCRIGGATYTLGVKTVGSDTALTLTQPFTGPTTSGVAWYAVPNQTLVGITTELSANLTTVYRSVLVNDANWMQFFSDASSVTIRLKDGSTVTGPGWLSLSSRIDSKASSGANSDITSLSGLTTALSIGQGGTGAKDKAGAWAALATYGSAQGTAAQGNDSRLTSLEGKSGGTISSPVVVQGTVNATTFKPTMNSEESGTGNRRSIGVNFGDVTGSIASTFEYYLVNGQYHSLRFLIDQAQYSFRGTGTATATSWQSTSDIRVKKNIVNIEDALEKVRTLQAFTYTIRGEASAGVSAQAVQKVLPEAVISVGDTVNEDGQPVKDQLAISYGAVTALNLQGTIELDKIVTALKADYDSNIKELRERMSAIDNLPA